MVTVKERKKLEKELERLQKGLQALKELDQAISMTPVNEVHSNLVPFRRKGF